MKNEIQILISNGQSENALSLLAEHSSDALLLQARYNNGKKQYNMGLIGFDEWQRIQAQINYGALELAGSIKTVVVQNNYIFINNVQAYDRPGNEYDLFFQAFEAMERMGQRENYPESEVLILAQTFHKYFGAAFLEPVDELQSVKFKTNTQAYKESRKESIIRELLTLKDEILSEFKVEVKRRKKETDWKEIWDIFKSSPTIEKWQALRKAIDTRMSAAIFTDTQRTTWGELSADIDGIAEGFLWVSRFNRSFYADLNDFISENLK